MLLERFKYSNVSGTCQSSDIQFPDRTSLLRYFRLRISGTYHYKKLLLMSNSVKFLNFSSPGRFCTPLSV